MTRGAGNDTGCIRGKVRLLTLRKASELELAGAMFADQFCLKRRLSQLAAGQRWEELQIHCHLEVW